MKKLVKELTFDLKAVGNGIVNFDGENSNRINKEYHKVGGIYKNYKFGKGFFSKKDDSLVKTLVTSTQCIKHNAFGKVKSFDIIKERDSVIAETHAELPFIVTGNMITTKKQTYKRSSAINMVDMCSVGDISPLLHIGTNSKDKNMNSDETDTSLFKYENVGEVNWEANNNNISIDNLKFIDLSTSNKYFNDDYLDTFLKTLNNILKNSGHDIKPINKNDLKDFYFNKSSLFKTSASVGRKKYRGILLNDDIVRYLLLYIFHSFINVNIRKNNASLVMDQIDIKLKSDRNTIIDTYSITTDTSDSDLIDLFLNIFKKYEFSTRYEKV